MFFFPFPVDWQIYSIMDGVEQDSSLVTTYKAGTTYEGRDIRVAKVLS